MSGRRLVLERMPAEEGHCPVPGLLVSDRFRSGEREWWAGTLVDEQLRVAVTHGGRLDLSGPWGLRSRHDAFRPDLRGPLRLTGTVGDTEVRGVVDQPGTRGWLHGIIASRERHRVQLRLSDGREWSLRAVGPWASVVFAGDDTVVGSRSGRPVKLAADAERLDHLIALLLLTGVARESLLVIGPFGA